MNPLTDQPTPTGGWHRHGTTIVLDDPFVAELMISPLKRRRGQPPRRVLPPRHMRHPRRVWPGSFSKPAGGGKRLVVGRLDPITPGDDTLHPHLPKNHPRKNKPVHRGHWWGTMQKNDIPLNSYNSVFIERVAMAPGYLDKDAVAEMTRVLKRGGRLEILTGTGDVNPEKWPAQVNILRGWLQAADLHPGNIRVEVIPIIYPPGRGMSPVSYIYATGIATKDWG